MSTISTSLLIILGMGVDCFFFGLLINVDYRGFLWRRGIHFYRADSGETITKIGHTICS